MQAKSRIVSKTLSDPELNELFNQMITGIDPNIVVKKYEDIQRHLEAILETLRKFTTSPVGQMLDVHFGKAMDQIRKFIQQSREDLPKLALEKNDHVLTSAELAALQREKGMNSVLDYVRKESPYKLANLGEKWKALKESRLVQECIMTLRKISCALNLEKDRSGRNDLEDKDALSAGFILNSEGDYLELLSFSALDFKQIYFIHADDIASDPGIDEYILNLLCIIYKRCDRIAKHILSPDIEPEQFANSIIYLLDQVKSRIPRCERAFALIEKSIGILKEKFNEYHKDVVTSQNPFILFERFVGDVARNSSSKDARLAGEFRRIIQFFQKQMQNHAGRIDPQIAKVFEVANANIDIMEKGEKD